MRGEAEDPGRAQRHGSKGALAEAAAACAAVERPPARALLKLARAALAAGESAAAAAAVLRLVDAADGGFADRIAAAGVLARCPAEAVPGIRRRLRAQLVATWTTAPFLPLLQLAAAREGMLLDIRETGFDQYFNATLDPTSALYRDPPDLVLLLPEAHALAPAGTGAEAEIARWTRVWDALARHGAGEIVQAGFAPAGRDAYGNQAAGHEGSRLHLARVVNAGLATAAAARGIGFVDTAALAAEIGHRVWADDRGWYLSKTPLSAAALVALAGEVAVVIAGRAGLARKCLALDLDNTLWGGVIGDDGLGGIRLGQGPEGEAFVDFQHAIKALADRGVILAVCSKNDPDNARLPFERHPDMVLKLPDIAAFVANWEPKSTNLRRLAGQLGIGLDAITFLDDNPYEREEVRRALPEVDAPWLPEDPTGFRATLEAYRRFEPAAVTEADLTRGAQYRARAEAEVLRETAGSLEDYQASLDMVARIGRVDAATLPRVVQLLNKTNQFNLTTRRRSQAEMEAFLARPGTVALWLRLADRFADHGLVALALAERTGDALEIDSFLMSCRVIGRGAEQALMHALAGEARQMGLARLVGLYRPSGRNGMVADLYSRLGFRACSEDEDGTRRFEAPAERLMPAPRITIDMIEEETPE